MKTRIIHDNSTLNYDDSVNVKVCERSVILIEIEVYKPGHIRTFISGGVPGIYWHEYGEEVSPDYATAQLVFKDYPNWEIFAIYGHRDGINVTLVKRG